jgi:hypothetical protein
MFLGRLKRTRLTGSITTTNKLVERWQLPAGGNKLESSGRQLKAIEKGNGSLKGMVAGTQIDGRRTEPNTTAAAAVSELPPRAALGTHPIGPAYLNATLTVSSAAAALM